MSHAINGKINAIFKKHGIRPGAGEEAFWNAVEDVRKISEEDADRLESLSDEWKRSFKAESVARKLVDQIFEVKNHLGEPEFQTYAGWRRAIKKKHPNATFDGDKDIAQALVDGKGVGEWDGEKGCIYQPKG